jgi:transcriptional regulator with XRE-family HTH domain
MGRSYRPRVERLGPKLREIRRQLDITLDQMIVRLDCPRMRLHAASISLYESGQREPPLKVLLQYARAAGLTVELLIDDDLDLPERLPIITGHEWIMKRVRMGHEQR